MPMKEMQPRLQLSFDEYADTWCTLMQTYCTRGLDTSITDGRLHLSDEKLVRYSMELSSVVLFIAMQIWNSRKRISEDIRKKSTAAIEKRFYEVLHSEMGIATEGQKVYESKIVLFSQFCRNLTEENAQKRQPDLIGFARYLTAQISDRPEQENAAVIKQLSVILIEAAATFFRLANNSFPDIQGLGKTKFIVQK